jgi:hypothetical protein
MANTIKTFITGELGKMALQSNQTYGKAIYRRHGVELVREEQDIIEGWAGGLDGTIKEGAGQRRRVKFTLNKQGGLQWHCTGNPKDHQIFCKHCVAAALAKLHEKRPD